MSKGHSVGLHTNKAWMFKRYNLERKSVAKIAKEAGVSEVSVYAAIKKFGLKR
jgi:hypothetical protein